MTSRKEEQAELLIQFGALIAPLQELVDYPEQQTIQTRAKACAKFTHDSEVFQKLAADFMRGDSGHTYQHELIEIMKAIELFKKKMIEYREDAEKLRNSLNRLHTVVSRYVLSIPCELDTEVLEAGSPFTAFMKIRSICETANRGLIFVDPYMGQGAVRRYFNAAQEHVTVTVVTKRRSGDEFRNFLDVSKLYSDERGQSLYCLMYHPNLHDRYLKCDDTVYHLGGSLKDAGRKSGYTISKIGVASDGEAEIRKLLGESEEQYGPGNPTHPV